LGVVTWWSPLEPSARASRPSVTHRPALSRPSTLALASLAILLCAAGSDPRTGGSAIARAQAAAPLASVSVRDLAGSVVAPLASTARAVVLVFVRVDCPISNRYMPALERLNRRAEADGADMWLVFVEPDVAPGALLKHLAEFRYSGRALHDPRHQLVAASGATITPEAAVFTTDREVRVAYRGRIDDQYVALGKWRRKAGRQDLLAAVDAVLAGRPPEPPVTQAVGCIIADVRR